MLNSMSYRQFLDWQYYAAIEPFGEFRSDVRTAQLAQMAHNVAVMKQHQKKDLTDFLLKWEDVSKPKEPPSAARIHSIFMVMARSAAAGAKDM